MYQMYQAIVEELCMSPSEIVEAFEEEYKRLAFMSFVFKIKRESRHGFYPQLSSSIAYAHWRGKYIRPSVISTFITYLKKIRVFSFVNIFSSGLHMKTAENLSPFLSARQIFACRLLKITFSIQQHKSLPSKLNGQIPFSANVLLLFVIYT